MLAETVCFADIVIFKGTRTVSGVVWHLVRQIRKGKGKVCNMALGLGKVSRPQCLVRFWQRKYLRLWESEVFSWSTYTKDVGSGGFIWTWG